MVHFRRRLHLLLAVPAVAAAVALWLLAGTAGAILRTTGPFGGNAKATPARAAANRPDGIGIAPGKIKHVFLIILENKSYDASFTGLNNNTYLWKTLPSQGVLVKHYFGTGHASQDNYISMVSGQAPQTDNQDDCPEYTNFTGHISTRGGSLRRNPNFGQMVSAAGPNAAPGQNGCVYPRNVQTLFNQLNSVGITWKGYAQDLGNSDPPGAPRHSVGANVCGAPFPHPGPTGSKKFPNPGSADATDQYVPKHFPFPWFRSLLNTGNCTSHHIANLFSRSNGLFHDLKREKTTPEFSWISPNNCSDGHDAVCAGNNLSGGWRNPTTPKPPVNYTGGLYAADLFLEHVIPMIERSAAFKDGGLIDVTFDEAFPPFTFTGDSFHNSTIVAPTAATSIANGTAGQNINGKNVNTEPTGPNSPLRRSRSGQALYPGPGFNLFLDRPSNCKEQTVPKLPANTCLLGDGDNVPGARTDKDARAPRNTSRIRDPEITIIDQHRMVSGTGIPAGARVGKVDNDFVNATKPSTANGFVTTGAFTLVNAAGRPIMTTATVRGITLAPETPQTDPLFSRNGQTNGGGQTGSVLISKFIKPGSVSDRFYNHYSWLRTMEDLFQVSKGSKGLDGQGHLGYAAQPGLAPFGQDVFNDPSGHH